MSSKKNAPLNDQENVLQDDFLDTPAEGEEDWMAEAEGQLAVDVYQTKENVVITTCKSATGVRSLAPLSYPLQPLPKRPPPASKTASSPLQSPRWLKTRSRRSKLSPSSPAPASRKTNQKHRPMRCFFYAERPVEQGSPFNKKDPLTGPPLQNQD